MGAHSARLSRSSSKAKLMIARRGSEPSSSDPLPKSGMSEWWRWWEQVLARGLRAAWHLVRSAAPAARAMVSFGVRLATSRDISDLRRPALAWLGGVAVLIGAGAGVLLASPGIDQRAAALAGTASLMWAGLRWLAVRVSAPRLATADPDALRGALSLGVFAYALAATPELRFAAWLAAGAISSYTLLRFGFDRKDVVRGIGFAWGVQAVVVVGGWLARNALIALVAAN